MGPPWSGTSYLRALPTAGTAQVPRSSGAFTARTGLQRPCRHRRTWSRRVAVTARRRRPSSTADTRSSPRSRASPLPSGQGRRAPSERACESSHAHRRLVALRSGRTAGRENRNHAQVVDRPVPAHSAGRGSSLPASEYRVLRREQALAPARPGLDLRTPSILVPQSPVTPSGSTRPAALAVQRSSITPALLAPDLRAVTR